MHEAKEERQPAKAISDTLTGQKRAKGRWNFKMNRNINDV